VINYTLYINIKEKRKKGKAKLCVMCGV